MTNSLETNTKLETLSKELEVIRREPSGNYQTIKHNSKNVLERLKNSVIAEDRIRNFQDGWREFIQSENTERKLENDWGRGLWTEKKDWDPEGEKIDWTAKILEEIIAQTFPSLTKDMAAGSRSWINPQNDKSIKKAEHWRIDAFELWCWRRRLRVPWTARRWNQSVLKEINPEYLLEGLMLKFQYFGHLIQRAGFLEKTLVLGKIKGRRRSGDRGWDN